MSTETRAEVPTEVTHYYCEHCGLEGQPTYPELDGPAVWNCQRTAGHPLQRFGADQISMALVGRCFPVRYVRA